MIFRRTGCVTRNFSALRFTLLAVAMIAVAVNTPSALPAQEIHGVILRPDSVTPASGVIVMMLDAASDSIVSRVLSGNRGYFSVKAPRPMTVKLLLLRLGQRPSQFGPFTLAATDAQNVRLVLLNAPITLAAIDVRGDNKCRIRSESSEALQQLFDEARKVLISSASAVSGVTNTATFTRYTRLDDRKRKPLAPENRSTSTGPTTRPFRSLDPTVLARDGYVIADRDSSTYWAPDAEVLFSEVFVERHCLQLQAGTGEHANSIGIGFRPADRAKNTVDIRGTLWLDKTTRELQEVAYEYDGLSRDFANSGAGGQVNFTNTTDGLWFVNQWVIRMPRATLRKVDGPSLPGTGIEMKVQLDGLKIDGGSVEAVRANGDLVYPRSAVAAAPIPVSVAPDAAAASAGTPAAAAVPAATALPRDPIGIPGGGADTVAMATDCAGELQPGYIGVILGRVVNAERIGLTGSQLVAEWLEETPTVGGTPAKRSIRRITAKSELDGTYAMCGLPSSRTIAVWATLGNRQSLVTRIQFTPPAKRNAMDIVVPSAPPN